MATLPHGVVCPALSCHILQIDVPSYISVLWALGKARDTAVVAICGLPWRGGALNEVAS